MEPRNTSSMQSSNGGTNDFLSNNITSIPLQYHSSMQVQTPTSQYHDCLGNFGNQSSYQNTMFWQQKQLPLPQQEHTITTTTTTKNSLPCGKLKSQNPRKRSRAPGRAPTTVLTTDTANFRAMVQEFTGIPSSPYSATASRKLTTGGHLERFIAGLGCNTTSNCPYPYRPVAQKPLISPSLNSNLSFQSVVQSGTISALSSNTTLTYNPGTHLQELSGIFSDDQVFISSNEASISSMRSSAFAVPHMGSVGDWCDGPLLLSNGELYSGGAQNIVTNSINNESNQQEN